MFKLVKLTPQIFNQSVADMDLKDRYDAILIPLGSFQLLYPRSIAYRTLANFNKHLKPGGRIILDLFVPWDALYENNEEESTERAVLDKDERIVLKSHNKANKYEQVIHSSSIYQKILNDQVIEEEYEQMDITWYYRHEMELILEKYGFSDVSYTDIKWNDESHMIFIGKK